MTKIKNDWSKMWENFKSSKVHIVFVTTFIKYADQVENKQLKKISQMKTHQWIVNNCWSSHPQFYQLYFLIIFKNKIFWKSLKDLLLILFWSGTLCINTAKRQRRGFIKTLQWPIYSFNSLRDFRVWST